MFTYKSGLYTELDLPDFDEIELTFSEQDIETLSFLARVANEHKYVRRIEADSCEPEIRFIKDNSVLIATGADQRVLSDALDIISVCVEEDGSFMVEFRSRFSNEISETEHLMLPREHLINAGIKK